VKYYYKNKHVLVLSGNSGTLSDMPDVDTIRCTTVIIDDISWLTDVSSRDYVIKLLETGGKHVILIGRASFPLWMSELMHGEITVSSVYNQGSVFTAKIPQIIKNWEPVGDFSQRYKELLKQKDTLSEVVYAPNARVLVVDDVPMNLLVAKGLMKYTGMKIDTAGGGQDALELIAKIKYDLIFLDHLMPVMDGVECLHHIREMKEHPNMTKCHHRC
jgi:hypothetical protein